MRSAVKLIRRPSPNVEVVYWLRICPHAKTLARKHQNVMNAERATIFASHEEAEAEAVAAVVLHPENVGKYTVVSATEIEALHEEAKRRRAEEKARKDAERERLSKIDSDKIVDLWFRNNINMP